MVLRIALLHLSDVDERAGVQRAADSNAATTSRFATLCHLGFKIHNCTQWVKE